jgi:hypothetical protein
MYGMEFTASVSAIRVMDDGGTGDFFLHCLLSSLSYVLRSAHLHTYFGRQGELCRQYSSNSRFAQCYLIRPEPMPMDGIAASVLLHAREGLVSRLHKQLANGRDDGSVGTDCYVVWTDCYVVWTRIADDVYVSQYLVGSCSYS